jgi:hypothetical protein
MTPSSGLYLSPQAKREIVGRHRLAARDQSFAMTALLDADQLDDLRYLCTERGTAAEHPLSVSAALLSSRHVASTCSGLMPEYCPLLVPWDLDAQRKTSAAMSEARYSEVWLRNYATSR